MEEQEIKTNPMENKTKRIIYISVILIFVFLIVWVSGIAAMILGL